MSSGQSEFATQLESVRNEGLKALEQAAMPEQLEAWRVTYLGRREGKLTLAMRGLSAVPPESRPVVGAVANQVKTALEEAFAARKQSLKALALERMAQHEKLDVTLPGRPAPMGRLHPTTQTIREVTAAFTAMGFQVVEGPEVELDEYNFELLNIPKGHPARDKFDTIWVDQLDANGDMPMLLRTHTSPVQARVMQKMQPPIRIIAPGKVYRYEAVDATHEWHFHQIEGLAVDEGITFANLKATLYDFARRIFGADRRVRFRCDFFPFVEPGVDMSIDCFQCKGKGVIKIGNRTEPCRLCKETGWIEMMGAGMVHPRVLEAVGYDSRKYTGFAFGMGVERIAILKYGIDDIRHFYTNDVRFLRQF
ncbi:MAG: phenylalanine--tRNA ligase subunit alpha [Dehalococcoidia bacterium]|nr:phenylalanine--tRNA ligase subunit alpha [Dehalococcoidia bacterium]